MISIASGRIAEDVENLEGDVHAQAGGDMRAELFPHPTVANGCPMSVAEFPSTPVQLSPFGGHKWRSYEGFS